MFNSIPITQKKNLIENQYSNSTLHRIHVIILLFKRPKLDVIVLLFPEKHHIPNSANQLTRHQCVLRADRSRQ